MRGSPGERLGQFIKRNKISIVAAAKALFVSRTALQDWIAGTKSPRAVHREVIERWTAGEVPVSSWPVVREEKQLLDRIVPHKPTGTLGR